MAMASAYLAATDVTAQRSLEEEKSLILDSMSDHLTYLDPELHIRHMNRAATAGSVTDEAIGRYCYELRCGRSSPCRECPALKTLATREPAEAEMQSPHGRTWHLRTFPVFDRDGAVAGVAQHVRLLSQFTSHRRDSVKSRCRWGP
jgi:PAS domain-containing protein